MLCLFVNTSFQEFRMAKCAQVYTVVLQFGSWYHQSPSEVETLVNIETDEELTIAFDTQMKKDVTIRRAARKN